MIFMYKFIYLSFFYPIIKKYLQLNKKIIHSIFYIYYNNYADACTFKV
jgi:hypothetical protein